MRILALLVFGLFCLHGWADDRPRVEVPELSSPETAPQESAWQSALLIPAFSPPLHAAANPEAAQTQVRLLWNKDFLFVRFICRDEGVVRLPVEENSPARDKLLFRADCVEVFLDPVGDGRAFVELQVSPDNEIFDAMHLYTADPVSGDDFLIREDLIKRESWFTPEWNLEGLQTTVERSDSSWQVTMKIPARTLLRRLGKTVFEPGMVLRANFVRLDYTPGDKNAVITNWAPVVAGRVHRSPAGMGYLMLTGATR